VVGGCRNRRWLDARQTSDVRWVLRLDRPLPPTGVEGRYRRYVLFARGVDEWWNVEHSFEVGRNEIRFRVA
jgi:hypothetical protein